MHIVFLFCKHSDDICVNQSKHVYFNVFYLYLKCFKQLKRLKLFAINTLRYKNYHCLFKYIEKGRNYKKL